MFRTIKDYIYSFIGLLGSIVTLYLFANNYYAKIDDHGRLAVLFLGGFAVWFFLETLWLKTQWGRERRYALSLPLINEGFSEIHDGNRRAEGEVHTPFLTHEEGIAICEGLCDTLSEAFSVITGTRCSVSVKALGFVQGPVADLRVFTYARCRQTRSKRDHRPHEIHTVGANSDFLEIIENVGTEKGRYFFSNYLPFRTDYVNSSFETYGRVMNNRAPWIRLFRWPLPYKSTIVVPICPAKPNKRIRGNLIGFLCVDSPNVGTFRRRYDIDLMEGVADGLFNLLSRVDRVGNESARQATNNVISEPEEEP